MLHSWLQKQCKKFENILANDAVCDIRPIENRSIMVATNYFNLSSVHLWLKELNKELLC